MKRREEEGRRGKRRGEDMREGEVIGEGLGGEGRGTCFWHHQSGLNLQYHT